MVCFVYIISGDDTKKNTWKTQKITPLRLKSFCLLQTKRVTAQNRLPRLFLLTTLLI